MKKTDSIKEVDLDNVDKKKVNKNKLIESIKKKKNIFSKDKIVTK